MTEYLFVLSTGLVAGAVSGVIGTGSSIMLLPVLVLVFGPKQAIPIMAVAAVMANAARVMAWWCGVDWRAVAAYSIPGAPAAALGAQTLLVLPSQVIEIALGLFFLAMIPARRRLERAQYRLRTWQLALAGAVIGFLTGIVLSTGPLSVPAFLAYGLSKGAFLSTEAASSLVLFVSKAAAFRELGALPAEAMLQGVIVGSSLMAGTFLGKHAVLGMSAATHYRLLDAVMMCAGVTLLWTGLR